jgi:hypothetical protein
VIQPVNEEFKGGIILFWQQDCLFFGLFEFSRECCPEELRMVCQKIFVYDETLLLRANYNCSERRIRRSAYSQSPIPPYQDLAARTIGAVAFSLQYLWVLSSCWLEWIAARLDCHSTKVERVVVEEWGEGVASALR